MQRQSTWLDRRPERAPAVGEANVAGGGASAAGGGASAGTPLPPIRSSTSLGTTHNPWAFTDPALKQMSPAKRGPRAKYFPSGFSRRLDPSSSTRQSDTVPALLITPLPIIRPAQQGGGAKKGGVKKQVTIMERAPMETMSNISPDLKDDSHELAPAREFRSAPASVLRTAAELSVVSHVTTATPEVKHHTQEITAAIPVQKVVTSNCAAEDANASPEPTSNIENNINKSNILKDSDSSSSDDDEVDENKVNNKLNKSASSDEWIVFEEEAEPSSKPPTENPTENTPIDNTEKSENGDSPIEKEDFDENLGEDETEAREDAGSERDSEAHAQKAELVPHMAVLRGEGEQTVQQHSRVVRIFLSSTFSDTKGERNYLARLAYPRLQSWCTERGLEFQVVDMRWGVTQDAVLDHATTSLCLTQIDECKRLSRGTNFVAFLGNRYGYQSPPTEIAQEEMDILLDVVAKEEIPNAALLSTWYRLDENSLPPKYVLMKISSVIDKFSAEQRDARMLALDEWNRVSGQLLGCLRQATQRAINSATLPPEALYKHHKSVTEQEIDRGIFGTDKPKALFFHRTLEGLTDQLTDPMAHKFIDLDSDDKGKPCINMFSKNSLEEVRSRLQEKLAPENIYEYSLPWASLGVNNKEYKDVDTYLTKLCDDFVEGVQKMTENELQGAKPPAIVEEITFHAQFTQKRCETFCGRLDILQTIRNSIENIAQESSPLVVYGRSGCGKTSVLSVVTRDARSWLPGAVTVVRYLGTTPLATKVLPMLQSVCAQLCALYDLTPKINFDKPLDLFQYFQDLIEIISKTKAEKEPLILIFDSLDQLSAVDGAHYMTWLPKIVPPHVKIITSTLEYEHNILHTLKRSMPADACYIKVENLTDASVDELVNVYLQRNGRTISDKQKVELNKVLESNTHPIFIRLLMDQAKRIRSFDPFSASTLPINAQTAMTALFDNLEQKYGSVFVSHAFTLLTICEGGMSNREMDDALSLADEVLNEVYVFHDPPIEGSVRVPPLLWARLSNEVAQYVTERDVHMVITTTWYHRLFHEYAALRYSNTAKYPSTQQKCFECLTELFSHDGKVCRTIVLTKRNKEIPNADRQVAHYPLTPGGQRKLMLLPYLLYKSKAKDMNKEIFCNLQWLLTKLKGTSYRQLQQDFSYTSKSNTEARIVRDTLKLGSSVLQENPDLLTFELAARLPHTEIEGMPHLKTLIDDCMAYLQDLSKNKPVLFPLIPVLPAPNELLKATIQGPKDMFEVYKDLFVLTRGTTTGFQVWNLDSLEVQHYLCDGPQVESSYTHQDQSASLVAQGYQTTLNLWDVETGSVIKSMNVAPGISDSAQTSLKWAIDVMCISNCKTKCLVKFVANILVKKSRLGICEFDTGKVTPVIIDVRLPRRENLVVAQFVQNDEFIMCCVNGLPPEKSCILFIETKSLKTVAKLELDDGSKRKDIKMHHDNYYYHESKPYFLIGCRNFNFIVVDLEKKILLNDLCKTQQKGRIADVCWYGDDIIVATYRQHTRQGTLLRHNDAFEVTHSTELRPGHPRLMRQVPGSPVLAVGYTYIGVIDFWDLNKLSMVFTLKGHSASVNTILFTTNGKTMLSISENRALKIWAVQNALPQYFPEKGKAEGDEHAQTDNTTESFFRCVRAQDHVSTNVESVLVLRGGREAVSTHAHQAPIIWNLEKPTLRQSLPHGGATGTCGMVQSAEGYFIFGVSSFHVCDETEPVVKVQKWNVTSAKLLATSDALPVAAEAAIALLPKCGDIAVLKRNVNSSELHVLRSDDLSLVRVCRIARSLGHGHVLVAPDDRAAVSVEPRNCIIVWQLADSTTSLHVPDKVTEKVTDKVTEVRHVTLQVRAQPHSVLITDQQLLIVGTNDGLIRQFQLQKLTEAGDEEQIEHVRTFGNGQDGEIWGLMLFPDGQRYVSVSNDKSLKVGDRCANSVLYRKKHAHTGRIRCCDVSADGTLLVTGGRDKALRVWAAEDGRAIASVNMYEDVYWVKFALNGRVVLALVHHFGERRLAIFRIDGNV